jgi:predicted transcriptional regulator
LSLNEETLSEYRLLVVRKPDTVDAEKDVEWVCRSLGFLESRDKKRTAYSVFRELIESARTGEGLSSDELASKLDLARGTIVHHLKKMIKSGLVIHHEGLYKLRDRSLKSTIQEVKRDVDRIFEDLENVVETVDENLGLRSR